MEGKTSAYVRIGDSPIIYQISESSYEALMACSYNDLRHDAVYSGDFSDITGFDLTLDGKTYSITSEEEDDSRTFGYDGEEELALTLHLDNENFSTLELVFNRIDGTSCLVTIDGEPTATVDRSAVVDLVEAFNEIVL